MNALLARDHLLHPDDPERPDDNTQDRVRERLAELLQDRGAVLAADAKAEVRTALADLHTIEPADILCARPSLNVYVVMDGLYALAKQEHANRIAALTEMAESDVAEAAAFRPDMEDAA